MLVALGGAIGSYLRSVISFASYAATGRMPKSTWLWWCILQTYIGMLLALLFYFIMRGTTMPQQASADQINPFTITGIAGLVGLFTQQATDKLAAFFGAVSIGSARQKRGNEVSDGPKKKLSNATHKA
jgi:fluoride ion exporter CrcB/FEX